MKRPPSSPRLRWRDLISPPARDSWAGLRGSERVRFTYSGRAAIYQYLVRLRQSRLNASGRPTVLVPAFHCPTVVDPVIHAGYDVRFYAVDRKLAIVTEDLLNKLDDRVAAVIFIRYFGLTGLPADLVAACRDCGARVIDDCSHSFLSADPLRLTHSGADATTYSFWKLVPTAVGGGVLLGGEDQGNGWPDQSRASWEDSSTRMRALLGQILEGPLDVVSQWRRRGAADPPESLSLTPTVRMSAADAYPYDRQASTWRMPATAQVILRNANLQHVVSGRRRNFQAFASGLVTTAGIAAVHGNLSRDACPWGFPVLLDRRPERDYLIRASGVPVFTFGEVLHPLLFAQHSRETEMLAAARYLADTLLAIAIHQGLQEFHVRGFAANINEFMSRL